MKKSPVTGKLAPDFELTANNGRSVSLADYRNEKNVVLYFYPKDDTPGCTTEACEFRDLNKDLYAHDTVVLGVSPDDLNSHQKFVAKYSLPFLLLSDDVKALAKTYGVWGKKTMYGKSFMGIKRATFVIAKDGRLVKKFDKVNPKGHAQDILDVVKSL